MRTDNIYSVTLDHLYEKKEPKKEEITICDVKAFVPSKVETKSRVRTKTFIKLKKRK